MNCARCNKRLSRKTARQIDGKVMCSACMFAGRARLQSRWKCETCGTTLEVEPAESSERGYFCCFASMTFLGVERTRDSRASPDRDETGTGSGERSELARGAEGNRPDTTAQPIIIPPIEEVAKP